METYRDKMREATRRLTGYSTVSAEELLEYAAKELYDNLDPVKGLNDPQNVSNIMIYHMLEHLVETRSKVYRCSAECENINNVLKKLSEAKGH